MKLNSHKLCPRFIKGYYCDKDRETKKYIKYRCKKKKLAYCYPDQVMNIFVNIDPATMQMPIEEYVALNVYNCRSNDRNA